MAPTGELGLPYSNTKMGGGIYIFTRGIRIVGSTNDHALALFGLDLLASLLDFNAQRSSPLVASHHSKSHNY